jgi:hypothetical protein
MNSNCSCKDKKKEAPNSRSQYPKNKPWNEETRETQKDKLPQMQFDEMLQGMRKSFCAHQSEP